MLLHGTTWYYMPPHATTCYYMLPHATTCYYMLLHATICYYMLLHATKLIDARCARVHQCASVKFQIHRNSEPQTFAFVQIRSDSGLQNCGPNSPTILSHKTYQSASVKFQTKTSTMSVAMMNVCIPINVKIEKPTGSHELYLHGGGCGTVGHYTGHYTAQHTAHCGALYRAVCRAVCRACDMGVRRSEHCAPVLPFLQS